MTAFQGILEKLMNEYDNIYPEFNFPKPFYGNGKIKAIVLGADPTHIINGKPREIPVVFGLDNDKSPYWRSINKNITAIGSIGIENLYVQNVCPNYFSKETSRNKEWTKIAQEYWIPFLKKELDDQFDADIPVLMTTEFILRACLNSENEFKAAKHIYNQRLFFDYTSNRLGRRLFAFYRHHYYNLNNHPSYREMLNSHIQS